MSDTIRFNIKLNIDGKDVFVQASESVKELRKNLQATKTEEEGKEKGVDKLKPAVFWRTTGNNRFIGVFVLKHPPTNTNSQNTRN